MRKQFGHIPVGTTEDHYECNVFFLSEFDTQRPKYIEYFFARYSKMLGNDRKKNFMFAFFVI